MSLITTVDKDGLVQSLVVTKTKRCPSCKIERLLDEYAEDGRTIDKLSPTCISCRKRGIRTQHEAEMGKKASQWGRPPAASNHAPVPVPPVHTPTLPLPTTGETSEQKVVTVLQLVLESLNSEERMQLVRVLKALAGNNAV